MSADMDERQPSVVLVIERHRHAFAALERYTEIVDQLDEDSDEWASEQLEISRLEGEVEEAAIAVTNVVLSSIDEVVLLLWYIEEFSCGRQAGYLLWPDIVMVDDRGTPWSFAVLENIRACLKAWQMDEEAPAPSSPPNLWECPLVTQSRHFHCNRF